MSDTPTDVIGGPSTVPAAPADVAAALAEDARGAAAGIELLTFTMARQTYAVDIMQVREIRGWTEPTPLPHAPHFMRGVINLRGAVLPILDLSERIGGGCTEVSARNVIVVVEVADQIAGLLVDAVSDILTVDRAALQPPPRTADAASGDFVSALTVEGELMIRVLDMSAVLGNVETTAQ